MVSAAGIRTRNELRYYKQRGKMRRLRIRVVPKSVKEWKTIVDLRINETFQTGAVRKPHLPGWVECGAVGNRTYRGRRKCLLN